MIPLTLAPSDPGALTPGRSAELQNYIERLRPRTIVVSDQHGVDSVERALSAINVHISEKVILSGTPTEAAAKGWKCFLDVAHKDSRDSKHQNEVLEFVRRPDPDRISLIVFTSGTSSGTPKGCPRHVASNTFVMDAQAPLLRMHEKTRFLLISANFRIIAPALSCATWKAGGAVVIPEATFNPTSALTAIERHSITHVLMVSAQLHAVTNDLTFDSQKLLSVEHAKFGGDMITKDVLIKGRSAFSRAKIAAAHGMSEGGGIFDWPFYETALEDVPDIGGICCIGKVAKGSKVSIYDVENDCVARIGEYGELHLCSPSIIKNYLGTEDEDAFYNDNVGRWFKTGDLATATQEGLVYIVGRVSQRIKRGGIPITPPALESCVEAFTGSQVAVVGVPHPTLGHEPFAVVQSFGTRNEDEIKQEIIDKFGKDYALGGAACLQDLGLHVFPMNATSKIMKMDLEKHVEKYLNR